MKSNRGMTLVEVLIVVGILGVVSLAMSTIFQQMFKAEQAMRARMDAAQYGMTLAQLLMNERTCTKALSQNRFNYLRRFDRNQRVTVLLPDDSVYAKTGASVGSFLKIRNLTMTGIGPSVVGGDCNGDGAVAKAEIQSCIYWALNQVPGGCPKRACDINRDGTVTISELMAAVNMSMVKPATPKLAGDCNNDGRVDLEEMSKGIQMALGEIPASVCPSFDLNGDNQVKINELTAGVLSNTYDGPITGHYMVNITTEFFGKDRPVGGQLRPIDTPVQMDVDLRPGPNQGKIVSCGLK